MKHIANTVSTRVEVVEQLNVWELVHKKTESGTGREDGEDSFFVCDLGDVVQKHARWLKVFPRIHPFYAIKCNPSEPILQCMLQMGTGFDCASKAEIRKMLDLGAQQEHIIFANPCKQSSHIKFAKQHGVNKLVFDNEIELLKIKKHYPTAKLVLRIQTDDSASICPFSMKYGAHADSCQMLIDTAKNLQLNVIGVSFHVGSGCQDATAFVKALELARKIFDYSSYVGYHMDLLDIGGGFPGTEDVNLSFEKIAEIVNCTLDELFPLSLFPDMRIIAEPGRYYAASAFTLATNVIAKRKIAYDKQSYQDATAVKTLASCNQPTFMYFLNDGLYGSFNCLFYDHAEVKPVLLKKSATETLQFTSSIWGPTCDGLDRVIENCILPEVDVGDWIIWNDMGAYTVAAGSAFNGFKTSTIYYTITQENLKLLEAMAMAVFPGLRFHSAEADNVLNCNNSDEDKTWSTKLPEKNMQYRIFIDRPLICG